MILFLLTACRNEVDKCVNSQVLAWEAKKKRDGEFWESRRAVLKNENNNNEWEVIDERDMRKKEEIEAESRIICLKLIKNN